MPGKGKQIAKVQSDGTVSLKVCKERGGRPKKPRRSRMGYWRAGVLIAVHVAIIAHIIWWVTTGRAVSPVEPSESMQTLEQGVINAGFVFFALALLATLLLGRFVCGWACHVIALQDLCSWMLGKVGIRPKPFRSRLLMLVPLGLALYMFVWPSLKREVVYPAMESAGIERPVWMKPVADLNGFETEFVVEDFWATFPEWYMVAPFLLVIGFASVYFLGAKGFCTYGCPYGGFFILADKISPLRVRVNDSCEGCGQCTAACTSNVRVHEEVRDFGKVIDPGCMKTMDCVAVCPNEALSIGFGAPAIFSRPREGARESSRRVRRSRLHDATWVEEVLIAVVFLVLFMCFRQMLGKVPMLMAVGMAGVGAFCAWVLIRMVRDTSVRIQPIQLKFHGKMRPAGWAFAALCVVGLAAAAWSGTVRAYRWRADMLHAQVDVPASVALLPEFEATPDDRAMAQRAMSLYARADAPADGGFGWSLNADELVRVAFLSVVAGDLSKAESALQAVVERGNPTDSLVFELAQVMRIEGRDEAAVGDAMRGALERHEELLGVRRELAVRAMQTGGVAAGEQLWESAPAKLKDDPWFWVERARYWGAVGSIPRARDAMQAGRATIEEAERRGAGAAVEMAEIAGAIGENELMGGFAGMAIDARPRDPALQLRLAALLLQMGRTDEGLAWMERAESSKAAGVSVLVTAARMRVRMDQPLEADALLRRAGSLAAGSPWQLLQVGNAGVAQGLELKDDKATQRGLEWIEQAIAEKPASAALHSQFAVVLANVGQMERAAMMMGKAAELGSSNALLAQRAAELYQHVGNADKASNWRAEAENRRGAKP